MQAAHVVVVVAVVVVLLHSGLHSEPEARSAFEQPFPSARVELVAVVDALRGSKPAAKGNVTAAGVFRG